MKAVDELDSCRDENVSRSSDKGFFFSPNRNTELNRPTFVSMYTITLQVFSNGDCLMLFLGNWNGTESDEECNLLRRPRYAFVLLLIVYRHMDLHCRRLCSNNRVCPDYSRRWSPP